MLLPRQRSTLAFLKAVFRETKEWRVETGLGQLVAAGMATVDLAAAVDSFSRRRAR
jgi:hypothetical protein